MTLRFNIDESKFKLELSSDNQIKYSRGKYTIIVFPTTRWDGCPKFGVYVNTTLDDGTIHRVNKEFDGLDYAMSWVDEQLS